MDKTKARDMTDSQLLAELNDLNIRWDALERELYMSGGHGGSPGEWIYERMNELETEKRRRWLIS